MELCQVAYQNVHDFEMSILYKLISRLNEMVIKTPIDFSFLNPARVLLGIKIYDKIHLIKILTKNWQWNRIESPDMDWAIWTHKDT
jgi:hypothetical protein